MHIEHLYGGSALETVGADGQVKLPRFVLDVAERRSESPFLVLGPHENDPCLTAYDPSYRAMLFGDSERLRLRDEAAGAESAAHFARARRAFGLTEQVGIDGAGQVALPPMVRRFGRIEGLALFVGTGGAFEIWNPHLAAGSGDAALAELARWRLGHNHRQPQEEEE